MQCDAPIHHDNGDNHIHRTEVLTMTMTMMTPLYLYLYMMGKWICIVLHLHSFYNTINTVTSLRITPVMSSDIVDVMRCIHTVRIMLLLVQLTAYSCGVQLHVIS